MYVNCETQSRSQPFEPRFKESILSRAQFTVTPTGLPPKKNRIDFARRRRYVYRLRELVSPMKNVTTTDS